jgi:hypothetical protein
MLFLNEHPIIILFDSRASHDVVSFACAERAKLTLVASGAPYVISTPKGRVSTNRIAHNVPLELSGRVFSTSLIVLSGQEIYVILGMRWMKMHKAILDVGTRLVHLCSPVYGKVTLHLSTIARIKTSLHHVVELKLEDIHVVQEFLDVFSDDLPGMPPERATEILQPGTTPVAKAPYKISPVELAELKIQLQDLLYKGFIHPSSSPWDCPILFMSKKDKGLCLCVDYRRLNPDTIRNK